MANGPDFQKQVAKLTMTVLLPPVFFVIFIALVLAVLLELVQEKESTSDC